MRVILAGYSLDSDVIDDLINYRSNVDYEVSPESLSAAYARISRDPRSIDNLREEAVSDVSKARKSNETIVFGMGHHSVAEHVQLNFDIMDVSRLCIEALEEARLCSYTEKSQRYIKLDGGYLLPHEIEKSVFGNKFVNIVQKQVDYYKKAVECLKVYFKDIEPTLKENEINGKAQEDARYILGLSTFGQLGFSANARNLEYVIRKLRNHHLSEVRYLGEQLYEQAKTVVPSLIILSDPAKFEAKFGQKVSDDFLAFGRADFNNLVNSAGIARRGCTNTKISLLRHTNDPDIVVLASLLHSFGYSYDENYIRNYRSNFPEDFKNIVLAAFKHLTEYDAVYREFEHVTFTFEAVVSASAFAQWKRHRMCTITKQDYRPILGVVCPDSLKLANLDKEFYNIIEDTNNLYWKMMDAGVEKEALSYVLTNGHMRKILITANFRELYHIARLRMDKHAQWEIRNQATNMINLVKEIAPVTGMLLCGKDQFSKLRERLY